MSDGSGQPAPASDLVLIAGNPAPANAEAIWYEGKGGRKLRMMFASEPKGGVKTRGTVFVCPGRTEFIEKYFEVARDLQARGFAVAIFDWPGQGLSERMLQDPMAGHVRAFGVYVDAFVRGIAHLGRRAPRPHVILAHSMGGAISLEALRTNRVEATAVCFCSPMWDLPILFFQRWYVRALRLFGLGARVALPPGPEETFANNQLTHDEQRWRVQRDLVAADPRLALGQPTIGWIVASLNVMREFREPGALDHLRNVPAVIAIAGEDTVVRKSGQRRLARRFKAGKTITVAGARHEILMETEDRRAQLFEAFDAMLKHAKI
ncbi:MAG: alpha/beta fold hydrolase [Alphaproteobacteria bacterium]|nr:alpha/beta fold hydrolase [Alphaproteobacteria bacterium]